MVEDRNRIRHEARSGSKKRAHDRDLGVGLCRCPIGSDCNRNYQSRLEMDENFMMARSRGLVRYCPICDGYEVTDKKIGVVGSDHHGVAEALFLRSFTSNLTLIAPDKALVLGETDQDELKDAGIECVDGPAQAVAITGECILVETAEGTYTFDSLYPALGSDIHTQLAQMAGAGLAGDGCILTDDHQRTTIPFLYAAGDVVHGLDQISHAMGEGGVAATTIRNDLNRLRPLRR